MEDFSLDRGILGKAGGGRVGKEEKWCKIIRKWKRDEMRGDEKETDK